MCAMSLILFSFSEELTSGDLLFCECVLATGEMSSVRFYSTFLFEAITSSDSSFVSVYWQQAKCDVCGITLSFLWFLEAFTSDDLSLCDMHLLLVNCRVCDVIPFLDLFRLPFCSPGDPAQVQSMSLQCILMKQPRFASFLKIG